MSLKGLCCILESKTYLLSRFWAVYMPYALGYYVSLKWALQVTVKGNGSITDRVALFGLLE